MTLTPEDSLEVFESLSEFHVVRYEVLRVSVDPVSFLCIIHVLKTPGLSGLNLRVDPRSKFETRS